MNLPTFKQTATFALCALAAILLFRFGLPVALPFLLGLLVALAAEPLVKLLSRRLSRTLSSAIGVTTALLAVLTILVLLTALLLRQLTGLSHSVPQVVNTVRNGLSTLQCCSHCCPVRWTACSATVAPCWTACWNGCRRLPQRCWATSPTVFWRWAPAVWLLT